jgi:4-amino-4-deoxy-L-arabinose transferase
MNQQLHPVSRLVEGAGESRARSAVPSGRRSAIAVAREATVLLLLAAFVAFAFQGTRGLWDPDEGRYTNVALRMLQTGDWVNPALDHEHLHFSKPPLMYWALATSYRIFGQSEWAARLPNALAFVCTALLVFGIARHLAPDRALLAACGWVTMLGPVVAGNIVSTDTVLALWETWAIHSFVSSGAFDDRPISSSRIQLMWMAFALAFLTKGPPGLLPLLGVVAWLTWGGRARELRSIFAPPAVLAFLLIGGAWYWIVSMEHPGLLPYLLKGEVAERMVSTAYHRNPGWFGWIRAYGPMLILGSLPWALVPVFARLMRRPRPAETALANPVTRFLGCWFTLPFAVLCISQSRLPLYVLPLMVPIALLIVRALPEPLLARRGATAATIAVAAVCLVALKGFGARVESERDGRAWAQALTANVDMDAYDEVVFVDMPATYSLNHYLRIEVERARLESTADPGTAYAPVESLCSELAEGERVLVVGRASHAAAIESAARRCQPGGLHELKRLRDLAIWTR